MSNPMEKAQKLGRQLFEIQTSTMNELAAMQQTNLQKYFETTREFTAKLPESQSPQGIFELQRQFAESLWNSYQASTQETGELVRKSWEEIGDAYKSAFSGEGEGK